MTEYQRCDKNKNGRVGRARGAGGVFAIGVIFQVSFFECKDECKKQNNF